VPREIRFRVPRVPPGLGANLLGLAGLIAVALAVGALAGSWWWSVGVGGVFAVALSWLASTDEQPAASAGSAAPPAGASSNVTVLYDAA
jgi:hypothetical protein